MTIPRIWTPQQSRLYACRWSTFNLARLLNATGERPPRVREMRRILGTLGLGHDGFLEPGGVFDHGLILARDSRPVVLEGAPYFITDEEHRLLAELKRFPTLRVEVDTKPSWYGSGTHCVRIEVIDPRRRFKPGKPAFKTRAVRRVFRAALRAEGLPVGEPAAWTPASDPTPERTP